MARTVSAVHSRGYELYAQSLICSTDQAILLAGL